MTGGRREALLDCGMLAAVVAVAVLPYVGSLGFYSDDWEFLSVMHLAGDQSLIGLVRDQLAYSENLRMRPTQAVHQALLYRAFSLEPLGYHLANLAVMVAVALTLYLLLRKVKMPRAVAVAVPAIYALMPNYSTNRFWFASFGYAISMGLWIASLHADLRAVESRHRTWAWKALAVTAMLAAGLGYEVVLPLFLVNVALAELHARNSPGSSWRRLGTGGRLVFHGLTGAAVIVPALYKASVASGVGVDNMPLHVSKVVVGALTTDFGSHLFGLPHTAWTMAADAGRTGVWLSLAVGLGVYLHLRMIGDVEPAQLSPRAWTRMVVAGAFVYVLGYAIFVTTERVGFSSTGIVNRAAAGAAVGFAFTIVALAGWAAAKLPWLAVGRRILPAAVALLCLAGTVTTHGLASYWEESWVVQQEVLAQLRSSVPVLPPGSSLLLAGICPYLGPAPVFESHWDLAGALQLVYGDPSLRADVVTTRLTLREDVVHTRIYDMQASYPYGGQLLLHDAGQIRTVPLPDEASARREVGNATDPGCPGSLPGRGTMALPFDRLRGKLEFRVLHPLLEN